MSLSEEQKSEISKALDSDEVNRLAQEGFKEYDKDGNGVISREELKTLLDEMHSQANDLPFDFPEVSEETINKVLENFDTNNDGQLQYDEFVEFTKVMLKKMIDGLLES